ncbi:hypothetical protein D3C80_1989140 [compost metagenome]
MECNLPIRGTKGFGCLDEAGIDFLEASLQKSGDKRRAHYGYGKNSRRGSDGCAHHKPSQRNDGNDKNDKGHGAKHIDNGAYGFVH